MSMAMTVMRMIQKGMRTRFKKADSPTTGWWDMLASWALWPWAAPGHAGCCLLACCLVRLLNPADHAILGGLISELPSAISAPVSLMHSTWLDGDDVRPHPCIFLRLSRRWFHWPSRP